MNNVWVKEEVIEWTEWLGQMGWYMEKNGSWHHDDETSYFENTTKLFEHYNLSEQPSQSNVSEDVENAAYEKFPVRNNVSGNDENRHERSAFIQGAEWQKQQLNNSAIGFAQWILENYEPEFINHGAWVDILDNDEDSDQFTTQELYNIYLKSINTK